MHTSVLNGIATRARGGGEGVDEVVTRCILMAVIRRGEGVARVELGDRDRGINPRGGWGVAGVGVDFYGLIDL